MPNKANRSMKSRQKTPAILCAYFCSIFVASLVGVHKCVKKYLTTRWKHIKTSLAHFERVNNNDYCRNYDDDEQHCNGKDSKWSMSSPKIWNSSIIVQSSCVVNMMFWFTEVIHSDWNKQIQACIEKFCIS